MRHLFLISCLLLMAIHGKSQDCVELQFQNQIGLPNSTTCIDLTVSGFDSMVLFYFVIEFDTAALSYQTSIPNNSLAGISFYLITVLKELGMKLVGEVLNMIQENSGQI